MKTGDPVTITCNGQTIDGVILLASQNGRSLALWFDGMLDGQVGGMPVLQDHDGDYRSLATDRMVTITPREVKPDG
jgi:hypothetical protein